MDNQLFQISADLALLDQLLPVAPPQIYTVLTGDDEGLIQSVTSGPALAVTSLCADVLSRGQGTVTSLDAAWPTVKKAIERGFNRPTPWVEALRKQHLFTPIGDEAKLMVDFDSDENVVLTPSNSPLPVYCAVSKDGNAWTENASLGPYLSLVPAAEVARLGNKKFAAMAVE